MTISLRDRITARATPKIGFAEGSVGVAQSVKAPTRETGDTAVKSLLACFGTDLEVVVLFGSPAREEATEASDLDFFVVVRSLPPSPLKRRRLVYDTLHPVVGKFRVNVSVIEMEGEELSKTVNPTAVEHRSRWSHPLRQGMKRGLAL